MPNTTSAAAIHALGGEHPCCWACGPARDHRRCSDPQARTRGPGRVETVCCCRAHIVLEEAGRV